jgi:DegV family protein with EDD domain
MLQIVSDSASLYSKTEALKKNLYINPLQVTINKVTYQEFEELSTEDFIDIINKGHIPKSSQPTLGDIVNTYEKFDVEDDVLVLCMADGLSGTYGTAVMATLQIENPDRFIVINTRTLCGPQRYLVDLALRLREEGKDIKEIVYEINSRIEHPISFLIPIDFGFLKRGGRLSPLAANLGGFLKLKPVLLQTDDGKRLDNFTLTRTFTLAVKRVAKKLKEFGVNENYIIYLAHDYKSDVVNTYHKLVEQYFPNVEIQEVKLSPAFITQGGPGCVAIQAVLK